MRKYWNISSTFNFRYTLNGPTAAVNVGYVENEIIINPNEEEREHSKLKLTVAGTEDKITMIEAGADEIPNDIMLEAIEKAHIEIKNYANLFRKLKLKLEKQNLNINLFQ